MTAFLASQPPKVYENNILTSFSKVAFASHLCRALTTVGMVPLVSVWPFDIIANPEFATADGIYVFPFDYPDSSTFRVGTTLYRPCINVVLYVSPAGAALDTASILAIDDAIRLDGAVSIPNIITKPQARGRTTAYGLTTESATTIFPSGAGQYAIKSDWLVHVGHGSGTDINPIAVGHWFVYLGPGGLFVYVGSGSSRSQFGDIMAVGWFSLGARIPGRARPVLEDSNLNRINPIVPFQMSDQGTSSDVWNTNSASEFFRVLRTKIHRMQFNLKVANTNAGSPTTDSSPAIVEAYLLNLENLEYPIFPSYLPNTVPSPRQISTGGGGHILGRPVLVPDGLESDPTQLFGPVVPELNASEVRPMFEDVFTGEGVRFCDVSAPLGVRVDPNTGVDWYLVPTYNTGQLLGLKIEPNSPGTIVDQLDSGTLVQTGDDHYNVTTGGYGASFPTAVLITLTPSSGNFFTAPGGVDSQLIAIPATSTSATHTVDWRIDVSVSDPPDTLYRVQVTIFNRDDPQSGTASAENFDPIRVQYSFAGAFVTVLTIDCAGTNAAHVNAHGGLSYNPTIYTAGVTKDNTSGIPRILLRFVAVRDDPGATTRGSNGAVTALHILKFRYL